MRAGPAYAPGAHAGMAMASKSGVDIATSAPDALAAAHPSECPDGGCCGCLGTCQGTGPLLTPPALALLHAPATDRAEQPPIHQPYTRRAPKRLIPPANPPPTLA